MSLSCCVLCFSSFSSFSCKERRCSISRCLTRFSASVVSFSRVLNGEPGVHSARYAGEHGNDEANNDLLLRRMEGAEDRSANFVCALALKMPGKEPLIAEGRCPGRMLYERRGTGGFGYDPLFLYEPLNKTFAELNEEEKNSVSHRARACEAMRKILEEHQA